jgi:peptidyl-prolyl cis-trans isomerase B (cyclophilin B)
MYYSILLLTNRSFSATFFSLYTSNKFRSQTFMKKSTTILLSILLGLQSPLLFAANPKVQMETSKGTVIIELYSDKAPKTVENFLKYTNAGTYNDTIFHRVIPNFMNQGGGFNIDYSKRKSGAPILNEADNGLKNLHGTIAMARTNDPHSATNQFFINTKNNSFLDHTQKNMRGWGYTVFGNVISGMDVMDRISKVKTGAGGPFMQDVPQEPVVILKMSEIKPETIKPEPKTSKPEPMTPKK